MILPVNATIELITKIIIKKALESYVHTKITLLLSHNDYFSILPIIDLVLGEIIEVSVGCKILVDMRMIEIFSDYLHIDQIILTVESYFVEKHLDAITDTNVVYQYI